MEADLLKELEKEHQHIITEFNANQEMIERMKKNIQDFNARQEQLKGQAELMEKIKQMVQEKPDNQGG